MKFKKLIILGIACLSILGVTACGTSSGEETETQQKEDDDRTDTNSYEEQHVVIKNTQGDYIEDGEWLYYISNSILYRSSVDGSYQQKLTNVCDSHEYEAKTDTIFIVDDWIYYIDEGLVISRIKKDGTETEGTAIIKATFRIFGNMMVDEKNIYYLDENGIHQVTLDGKNEKIIVHSNNIGYMYDVIDGFIYYLDDSDGTLRKVKCDDEKDNIVIDDGWNLYSWYYMQDGWIYCNKKGKICRINTNSLEVEDVITVLESYDNCYIKNNVLYYTEFKRNKGGGMEDGIDTLYRVNLDGTSRQMLFECKHPAREVDYYVNERYECFGDILYVSDKYIYFDTYIYQRETTRNLYILNMEGVRIN